MPATGPANGAPVVKIGVDQDVYTQRKLCIYVNGRKFDVKNADPEMTLIQFLRGSGLTGTKLGCGEGGCGACTVMLSHFEAGRNGEAGKIVHRSANACLVPLCAVDSMAVTTVEGLGSVREGRLDPVQARISASHGSQCGFCTPGIVMALYAYLRAHPNATRADIEGCMDGNLCRCTGYRPILDAAKSFGIDAPALHSLEALGAEEEANGANACGDGACGKGGCAGKDKADCCKGKATDARPDINGAYTGVVRQSGLCPSTGLPCDCLSKTSDTKAGPAKPVEASSEVEAATTTVNGLRVGPANIIFPPALQTRIVEPMLIKGERCSWYRPNTLVQLLQLQRAYPTSRIIVGNTEVAIEVKFRGLQDPVRICPSEIPELNRIDCSNVGDGSQPHNHVVIGAAVPLTVMGDRFKALDKELAHAPHVLRAAVDQLKWFAGHQIRNVACLGGNIATASPISDLNPVWVACGAFLTLASLKQGSSTEVEYRRLSIRDFFLHYRRTALRPSEIIVDVVIPLNTAADLSPLSDVVYTPRADIEAADGTITFFKAYKQARRRDDDIAIVTAGIGIVLKREGDGHIISDIRFGYGGMAVKAVPCPQTTAALTGHLWEAKDTLELALKNIEADLPLAEGAPGGMINYRRSLTTSFFYKFFLEVNGLISDAGDRVMLDENFGHTLTKGQRTYELRDENLPVHQPVMHMSGQKQVTGEAVYCDDIPNAVNGLHGALVTTTKAHAKILSIDGTAALAYPGVVAFYTADDIPGCNIIGATHIKDEEILVSKLATSMGQVLAVVVAETRQTAVEAVRLVKVDYEELTPVITTIDQAIQHKSFFDGVHKITRGQPKDEIAKAQDGSDPDLFWVEGEMNVGGQDHFYLETQQTYVVPEEDEVVVYASTQNPTKTQAFVASVLGVPMSKVVCRVKRMGGGFGGKETKSVVISCVTAVCATRLNQPVRIITDRDIDMINSGGRHPFKAVYKIAMNTKTGKLHALDIVLYSQAGYSTDLSQPVMDRALFHIDNAYFIPHVYCEGHLCRTHTVSNTAFRGFGGPQGMMMIETAVDHLHSEWRKTSAGGSGDIGRCVAAFRQFNLYKEGERAHYGQEILQNSLGRLWEQCLKRSDYNNRLEAVRAYNAKHVHHKRGIAIIPVKFGMSFTLKFLNQTGALVHLYQDGTVLVTHGGTEMGQGLHTKMAQIAAGVFNIDLSKVYISETATDKVANTPPTAASVGSDMNGMAVLDACQQIHERLKPVYEKNPGAPLAAIARLAWMERINLTAQGFSATPNLSGYNFDGTDPDDATPFNYYTYGIACAEVELDTLTGDFRTQRADVVMDLGNSLNPAVDVGQVEGAFVQGMGWCTMEELVHFPNGHLFTRGPSTYKIPGFNDVPIDFRVSLLKNNPNPRAIHSSRGVGEPPYFLASSVFFALKQAVRAARDEQNPAAAAASLSALDGLETYGLSDFQFDSPATCERLRMACVDQFTTGATSRTI